MQLPPLNEMRRAGLRKGSSVQGSHGQDEKAAGGAGSRGRMIQHHTIARQQSSISPSHMCPAHVHPPANVFTLCPHSHGSSSAASPAGRAVKRVGAAPGPLTDTPIPVPGPVSVRGYARQDSRSVASEQRGTKGRNKHFVGADERIKSCTVASQVQ